MTDYWQLPDWQHWLSAIRAAPDDDVTRLACADWLDEHGYGERAEFVRVQVELAKSSSEKTGWLFIADGSSIDAEHRAVRDDNPHTERLQRRERELFTTVEMGFSPFDGWSSSLTAVFDSEVPGSVVRRGFIESVRAPLATLYGGECRGCNGVGDDAGRLDQYTVCPTCHGTGRIVGVLPDLLRREPVLRVEASDKEPATSNATTTHDWLIEDLEIGPISARLPADLFTYLEEVTGQLGANVVECATREAATNALSAALLAWGLGQIREGVTR